MRRALFTLLCILTVVLLTSLPARAVPTAFTYQGKLTDAGNPANGNFDMRFTIWNAQAVGTGTQIGPTLTRNPVPASAGIFTVNLDFTNAFTVDTYLEIGVRPAGSGAGYTTLTPRQQITASPYAVETDNASY